MLERYPHLKNVLLLLVFTFSFGAGAWEDPSYGTSNPPNYKKKKSSPRPNSHAKPYVYSSRFDDPYYGTSNPPGYNEKKAKKMGKIYIPPKAEPLSPIYGTGVPKKRSN
jgi:hypothetical protein